MKEKIELILQHGWGFDAGAWDGWRTHMHQLPEFEINAQLAERGYFGAKPWQPEFSEAQARKVLIAHSTGLHFIPQRTLLRADLLVIISSFLRFHAGDGLEQRRSRRTLRMMLNKLDGSPMEVLDDFYSNCYHPLLTRQVLLRRSTDPDKLDLVALKADLELIDGCALDESVASLARQTLILHGDNDKVVAPAQAVALQKSLPRSFLIMFEGVGHALPFTHTALCWLSVRNALRSVLPVGSV